MNTVVRDFEIFSLMFSVHGLGFMYKDVFKILTTCNETKLSHFN